MRFLRWAWNGLLSLWHRCLPLSQEIPAEPEPEPLPSFGDSGMTAPRGTPEFQLQEAMYKAMKTGGGAIVGAIVGDKIPIVASAAAVAEAVARRKDPSDPWYFQGFARPSRENNLRGLKILSGQDRDPDYVIAASPEHAERINRVEKEIRQHLELLETTKTVA